MGDVLLKKQNNQEHHGIDDKTNDKRQSEKIRRQDILSGKDDGHFITQGTDTYNNLDNAQENCKGAEFSRSK